MKKEIILVAAIFINLALFQVGYTQSTEITYQGQLQNSSMPASGNFDFEFLLFDSSAGGTQIGSAITRNGVAVVGGIFSVNLDFGASFPGATRFLEIRVRQAGGGAFTTLAPRQSVTSTPYAVKSLTAENAANATNAVNATNATNATNASNATTATSFSGALIGDVTGTQGATTVARLQGRSVASTAPLNDQVLKFNTAANQWLPGTDNTSTGGGGVTAVTATGPLASSGGTTPNISLGQVPTANIADAAVTAPKIATGQVVKSVNTLKDDVMLAAGANITITPSGNTLTIASTGNGGGNAILNQTTPQAGANFNISGTGTANILNAGTQFNIGGNPVLGVAGQGNLFAGLSSGAANPTGNQNSFFGAASGFSTTTGSNNVFVGNGAGSINTTGASNSFVGQAVGTSNTTGVANSFFGSFAGNSNTTGSNNTAIGDQANVGSGNLSFATAIGAQTTVSTNNTVVLGRNVDTVQVPGSLNVAGTFTGNINGASITNLNASNISTGTLNNARLGVIPVANGGTGSATQNFVDLTTAQTIAGNKTFSATLSGNVVNATTQYSLAGGRILSSPGLNNLFAGFGAGRDNTSSGNNSFVGHAAGLMNTTGANNAFFGANVGFLNTTGGSNAFFGSEAGFSNTTGGDNAFFGFIAGQSNTTGGSNAFFGRSAGQSNTAGGANAFFGLGTGSLTTTGSNNAFFGTGSGQVNTTGSNNTAIGNDAEVSVNNLNFATAIGAGAVVSTNNAVVLGRAANDNVGIGTTAPTAKLTVAGSGGAAATGAARFDLANSVAGLSYFQHVGNTGLWQLATGSTTLMVVTPTGDVGIGNTNSPTQKLDVLGNIRVGTTGTNGCIQDRSGTGIVGTCSSDLRFKKNVSPFGSVLAGFANLQPVTFDWRADEFKDRHFGTRRSYGLIAQDVEQAFPDLVTLDEQGFRAVNYSKLPLLTIQAVKEQQVQIDEQRKVIASLQGQIDALKAIVCRDNKEAEVCRLH